jgi:hypothetical protein
MKDEYVIGSILLYSIFKTGILDVRKNPLGSIEMTKIFRSGTVIR